MACSAPHNMIQEDVNLCAIEIIISFNYFCYILTYRSPVMNTLLNFLNLYYFKSIHWLIRQVI